MNYMQDNMQCYFLHFCQCTMYTDKNTVHIQKLVIRGIELEQKNSSYNMLIFVYNNSQYMNLLSFSYHHGIIYEVEATQFN